MKEKIINAGGDIFLNTKIENIEEKKNLIYINKNSSVSYNIIIYTKIKREPKLPLYYM
jgi:uncharacterized FAD-dependent dehydrogenase